MKYGFILIGTAPEVVELAQEAEAAGWDGVFLPDDWMTAWIKLTAIAMRTQRISLGTMLTPLPEQSPWYVAAQTATLDQLSGGRAILTAGLGVLELDKFGMQDNKVRAQRLDEGLTLLDNWWHGKDLYDFTYEGRYYHLQKMQTNIGWHTHQPHQHPRIPIWVVGGAKQSQIRRAASFDGAVIVGTPEELYERRVAIEALRTHSTPFDVITEGETPPDDPASAAAIVRPYAEAGATWWLESMWELEGVTRTYDIRTRISAGPPKIS
ncbi:LLM class flavin-dependent oxidoreductase [Tengunoibacter tsumagoiensis]|uniref:Luciferase-like protein n=1 Tax=Tengunoibacter tsumagoiensis TaxID=2014871 RepID=A0A402A8X4_9CHLR|nr:LLM class flavin-dependent oxidoreductase [Tengunoibacter tsumagoiensis]GCE15634.1 luciferase-like protein [Tengunoibacter tsumagoiensis]